MPSEQYQYHEDLVLNATWAILVSPERLDQVVAEASRQNIQVDKEELLQNSTIERKHAFWELRYRHRDPTTAQAVANLWAEKGYQTILDWSRSGKTANYFISTPAALASLPQAPVNYGRNQLMLAGCLAGLIAGILLVEGLARWHQ